MYVITKKCVEKKTSVKKGLTLYFSVITDYGEINFSRSIKKAIHFTDFLEACQWLILISLSSAKNDNFKIVYKVEEVL